MRVKSTNLKPKVSLKVKISHSDTGKFPIIGIGASAGGLEALEQFFANTPKESGIAYVVIQHLDPTQKGMLPELLQRVSKMKVFQVKDQMVVEPNRIYVIPPNKSMSILMGVLYLFEPMESRGMRLPIDFFLRSLADDRKELSIGLILSGMGSDGSIGCRAIKEKGGILMVQDPGTAKFDSMPRNAIDAALIDIIAPANELPKKLIDFLKFTPVIKPEEQEDVKNKSSIEKVIILLRIHTGNDFSLYKKNTIYRRIERRMGVHKIDKISSYVLFLQENPKEMDFLFKELMIGVTNFFRDVAVWGKLKDTYLPDIIGNLPSNSVLRAWVPGCSTGEEAYSLGIVFKEALEEANPHGGISLQIFATDLDTAAISVARKGIYSENIIADVSPERLNRFFVKTDEGYRLNTEIREMVVFAPHNIIMHPPFTKLDILSCRNLLIYMDPELQYKLLGLFYYSLNPEGIMLLGSAETLGKQSHFFTPLDSKLKIFKRNDNRQLPDLDNFPSSFFRTKPANPDKAVTIGSTANIQSLTDQLLLQQFSPAGVLVNENGDILYISGHIGKYMEPAVGKANMNIFAMLREGLHNEFPLAFRKALLKKEKVVLKNIKVGTNGSSYGVDVNIHCLDNPESLKGTVLIIFSDAPEIIEPGLLNTTGKKPTKSIMQRKLEEELQQTRIEMQNTLEEMQTSQEELKSTNEELQSTNEELQSTNEELTTSKEEMQSLNEELQTVNYELQSKVDDFSRVNNDMKNLLNSTEIATLFLDKDLNIRRFTLQANKIFKMIKSDIGRPFTDLVTDLIYPGLADDSREVLNSLVFIQKQIASKDGQWFSIRIMPYRTYDDKIDGLVITFINLSDIKQVEGKLHETLQMNTLLLNSSSDLVVKLSKDLKIKEFNFVAEKFFGKKRDEVINKDYIQTFIPNEMQKKAETRLKAILKKGLDGIVNTKVIAAREKIRVVEFSVNVLLNNQKNPEGMIIMQKN